MDVKIQKIIGTLISFFNIGGVKNRHELENFPPCPSHITNLERFHLWQGEVWWISNKKCGHPSEICLIYAGHPASVLIYSVFIIWRNYLSPKWSISQIQNKSKWHVSSDRPQSAPNTVSSSAFCSPGLSDFTFTRTLFLRARKTRDIIFMMFVGKSSASNKGLFMSLSNLLFVPPFFLTHFNCVRCSLAM